MIEAVLSGVIGAAGFILIARGVIYIKNKIVNTIKNLIK